MLVERLSTVASACSGQLTAGSRAKFIHLNQRSQGGLAMARTQRMGFMTMALVVTAALHATPLIVAANQEQRWVTTWSTAMVAPNTVVFGTSPGFDNQTLRQIVHTSIGGNRVRVRLSTFGAGALHIGAARIALRATGSPMASSAERALCRKCTSRSGASANCSACCAIS